METNDDLTCNNLLYSDTFTISLWTICISLPDRLFSHKKDNEALGITGK